MSGGRVRGRDVILAQIRAKHPRFSDLEALVHRAHPDFDELEVALAVCTAVNIADAETDEILADANPGTKRVQ